MSMFRIIRSGRRGGGGGKVAVLRCIGAVSVLPSFPSLVKMLATPSSFAATLQVEYSASVSLSVPPCMCFCTSLHPHSFDPPPTHIYIHFLERAI